jgi:hypothetical protein
MKKQTWVDDAQLALAGKASTRWKTKPNKVH